LARERGGRGEEEGETKGKGKARKKEGEPTQSDGGLPRFGRTAEESKRGPRPVPGAKKCCWESWEKETHRHTDALSRTQKTKTGKVRQICRVKNLGSVLPATETDDSWRVVPGTRQGGYFVISQYRPQD